MTLGRRILRLAARAALLVILLVVGVSLAKVAQYAAVDQFGASLGFDLASLIGVAPVIALYGWLAHRFPRAQPEADR